MATFAKSTFNAAVYSASRPTYPKQLFEYIFSYHRRKPNARWDRAVDLGCGTGQATALLDPFREVIGIDPSENMVKTAAANYEADVSRKFSFKRGSIEDLASTGIASNSVDMLIAAQACHWFDWARAWPETGKVLREGGTAAFWVYSEFRLPSYPTLTPLITSFAQGNDPKTSLGPYFQRPGRTILENHLLDVPSPTQMPVAMVKERFVNEERVYFAGNYHTSTLPRSQTLPIIMRKEIRWRDLLGYFRTWSSLHAYHEVNPEDKTREQDERFLEDLEEYTSSSTDSVSQVHVTNDDVDVRGGDIAVRFWKDLRSAAKRENKDARVGVNDPLMVEWPLALILVSKSLDRT